MKRIIVLFLFVFVFSKTNAQARIGLGYSSSLDEKGIMDMMFEVEYDFEKINMSFSAKTFIFLGPVYVGSTYNVNIVDHEKVNSGFNLGVYFREVGRGQENYPTIGISWFHYEKPYFAKVSILDHRSPNLQLTFGIFLRNSPINLRFKKVDQTRCYE
jgi:hypothetical protein